jgi:hypothetical protein
MINTLGLEGLLELMSTEIENDDIFIRIDRLCGPVGCLLSDDASTSQPLYLGPFPSYES